MAFSRQFHGSDILQRDKECHPPRHSPDINVFSREDMKLVQSLPIDHPAGHVEIAHRIHEREVQPFGRD